MTNIIDLTELLKAKQETDEEPPGVQALKSLDEETANMIITFILNMTLTEVRIGLGLEDIDEDIELKVFEKIDQLYDEAAGGCYFCSGSVDPNEVEFSEKTDLCMACSLKLGNFVQALGIDPGKVFKGMHTRKVQKAHIKY